MHAVQCTQAAAMVNITGTAKRIFVFLEEGVKMAAAVLVESWQLFRSCHTPLLKQGSGDRVD